MFDLCREESSLGRAWEDGRGLFRDSWSQFPLGNLLGKKGGVLGETRLADCERGKVVGIRMGEPTRGNRTRPRRVVLVGR